MICDPKMTRATARPGRTMVQGPGGDGRRPGARGARSGVRGAELRAAGRKAERRAAVREAERAAAPCGEVARHARATSQELNK